MMVEEINNRRPIRSRNTQWASKSANFLKRKGIAPNDISLLSIIFAEIAGIALLMVFYYDNYWLSAFFLLLAIIGIQARLVCNLLDGMVAVEGGLKSPVGPVYNELPDRISDVIIFIGIGYGLWMFSWAAYLGWAAALFSVMTAYVRLLGGSCGLEQKFLGPMAKQQRMAVLSGGCALSIIIPSYAHGILYISLWIIAIGSLLTTIWRSYNIIVSLNIRHSYDDINKKNSDNNEDIDDENFPRITVN